MMRIHFFVPESSGLPLNEMLEMDLNENYPYWLGGVSSWVVQTYLILREHQEGMTIGRQAVPDAVNVGHVSSWREAKRTGEYRVSTRGDYRRLWDVDFEIVQNRVNESSGKQLFMPHWPLPRIVPRSQSRSEVVRVAYAGRSFKMNLAGQLRNRGGTLAGLCFAKLEQDRWHDMRNVDVMVAVRKFGVDRFDTKPPSKLFNAWWAGVPLVAGYDSAYSQVGEPGVDYVRVRSERELVTELERLRDDPRHYSSIVAAGNRTREKYSHEQIARTWLKALAGPVKLDWERWNSAGRTRQPIKNLVDEVLDDVSRVKARILRGWDHPKGRDSAE